MIPTVAQKHLQKLFLMLISNLIFIIKKLGVATARAGNVIGGGDWSENRVIPDFIKSILKRKNFFKVPKIN